MHMWNISQLKERAKKAFVENYWWCVLVALILTVLVGNGGGGRGNHEEKHTEETSYVVHLGAYFSEDGLEMLKDQVVRVDKEAVKNVVSTFVKNTVYLVLGIVGILFTLVLKALALNPLQVGCRKFFFVNACSDTANPGLMGDSFKNGYYGNTVVAMFLRDLYTFLWTLLLVVPGIVKMYEYRMVPYLMAEYPEMHYQEALDKSRLMMDGEKWNAFMLDFSFIGWYILSAMTGGLVGIFWTRPYKYAADAELYLTLSGR